MNTISMKLQADELIRLALQEDISSEDVTTNSVMKEAVEGEVQLICKQDGIVAGLDVFKRVFELLDENTKTEFLCKDGDAVKKGQLMGTVTGDIRVLLSGERVALNYLQRMSGIATYTHTVSALLKGTKTKLLDTRKTTPMSAISICIRFILLFCYPQYHKAFHLKAALVIWGGVKDEIKLTTNLKCMPLERR